eukprot:SAG31_NODE_10_length_40133_cov_27.863041_23_plen_163_part_00
MKYENLKGPEIEMTLRLGMEAATWFHNATYGEAHRPVVDEYLDKLLARGFIGPATSSKTVSRLLLVWKARGPITPEHPEGEDRGWRVCIVCLDARKLNSVTENVLMHLPSTEEVMVVRAPTNLDDVVAVDVRRRFVLSPSNREEDLRSLGIVQIGMCRLVSI